MKLYHGSHDGQLTIHEGICLAEQESFAEQYAGMNGEVFEVELDDEGLNVVDVPGYDHDTNDCPADNAEYRAARAAEGADVLRYEDEDEMGREHTCYRLVSDRALAAAAEAE